MRKIRGMKYFSFLLSFIFVISFANINTYAEDVIAQDSNKSLTIRTVISGDPSVVLTSNARITLTGQGKNIVMDKQMILSGTTVVEDVPAGTYSVRTKNIQTKGFSVKFTLDGVEATSVELNPEVDQELVIEMCYTKQEFKDLPHDNLNADSETDFYNPVYGTYDLVLEDSDCNDDSERLQQAIDEVNQNNGGTLTIRNGNYYIQNIHMKSNVHVKVASGAAFYMGDATPVTENSTKVKKGTMFVFDDDKWVENVSIEALDPNERYTIELDTGKYDSTFAFSCNTVRNFKIADANIHGDYKAYQKIGIGFGEVDGVNVVANQGIISNCHTENVVYGYGLIQIQAGENILFKDLSSVGGVTLRIENGFVQYAGENTPRVNGIYARNISCKNGHETFMCADHGIPIGYFDVQGVSAESCICAADINSGNADSILKNVSAVYGEDTQLKTKNFSMIPVELTRPELFTVDERDPINFGKPEPMVYKGPSVAAVILSTYSRIAFDESEVKKCEGFKYQVNDGKVLRLKQITLPDGSILPQDKLSISGLQESYEYTGSEIIPDITITYDGVQLENNKDYILECSNNVEIGAASMKIVFKREYIGFLEKSFEIVEPAKRNDLNVTVSIEGDPVQLAANARIMIAGPDSFHTLKKSDIVSGKMLLEDVKSGTYTVYNRDVIDEGYSMKVLVNEKEENTAVIDLASDNALNIRIIFTKVGLSNLPCEKLNPEDESDFYKPVYGECNKILTDTDDVDDSERMQQLIDEISENGGGTLTVEPGTYNIVYVKLKSNVHIKVKENVVFHLVETSSLSYNKEGNAVGVMFSLGDGGEPISNVSVESAVPGNKYIIDQDTGFYEYSIAFNCLDVSNFKLSDADIRGDYKPYSKISCGPLELISTQVAPKKGIISNMTINQAMYGYGLIQVQSAQDILFKDLYSIGGVTLRLENGAVLYNGEDTLYTNGIYARNIYCKDGHEAVMCASHGIPLGYFDIQHVFAESCEAAVGVSSGNTDSKLRDVNAIYGDKAQLKSKNIKELPAELATRVSPDPKDPGNTETTTIVWIGPSVAAVALGNNKIDFNQYDITTCEGFLYPDNHNGLVVGSIENFLPDDFTVDVEKFAVSGLKDSYTETGSAIEPDILVTYDGTPLVEGEDYFVELKDNTKVGTASAVITFERQYHGNLIEKKFNITKEQGQQEDTDGPTADDEGDTQNPEDTDNRPVPVEPIEDAVTTPDANPEEQEEKDKETEDTVIEDKETEDKETEDKETEEEETKEEEPEDKETEEKVTEDKKTEEEETEDKGNTEQKTKDEVKKDNGPTTGEEEDLPIVPGLILFGTIAMGYLLIRKRKVAR